MDLSEEVMEFKNVAVKMTTGTVAMEFWFFNFSVTCTVAKVAIGCPKSR